MLQVEHLKYPHRTNPDGTIDSICPCCYVTIGTSVWETDLERLEVLHVCDPEQLEYFRQRETGRPTKRHYPYQ
jgi:hypothetical protein